MGGVAFKENRNIWEVLTFAKIDFHFTKCVLSSHCGRPRAADVKTFWVQSQRHHPHSQRKSAPAHPDGTTFVWLMHETILVSQTAAAAPSPLGCGRVGSYDRPPPPV